MTYASLLLFAALLAVGQLLFKKAAMAGAADVFPWAYLNGWMALALLLYGAATLLWTWILRTTPLSTAYPFAALAFVLVPLLASAVFGEELTARLLIGAALIVAGILVSAS
jgi:undecaprenyl phosphate-alpha-L-ara4N flippase subunit ArnE